MESQSAPDVMRGSLLLKDRSVGFRGIRPWLKRFFVLSVKYLGVYKKESDVEKGINPINVWPSEDVLKVEYFPNKRLGCRFNISLRDGHSNNQLLELDGPNIREARLWVRKIKLCKEIALAMEKEANRPVNQNQNVYREEVAKRARMTKDENEDEERSKNLDEPELEEIPQLPMDFGLTSMSKELVPDSIHDYVVGDYDPTSIHDCMVGDNDLPLSSPDDGEGLGVGSDSDKDDNPVVTRESDVSPSASPVSGKAAALVRLPSDVELIRSVQNKQDLILNALTTLGLQRFHSNFVKEEYVFEDLVHVSDEELALLLPEEVPRAIFGAYLIGQGRVAKQTDGYAKEAQALKASIAALQGRLTVVANKFAVIDLA